MERIDCPLGGTYTVVEGDTFSSIARAYGLTEQALAARNPFVDPMRIGPGQVLCVPETAGQAPGAPRAAPNPAARPSAPQPPQTTPIPLPGPTPSQPSQPPRPTPPQPGQPPLYSGTFDCFRKTLTGEVLPR